MHRIILLPPETQNPRWNPGGCASQATLRITSDCNMGSNLLQVFNYIVMYLWLTMATQSLLVFSLILVAILAHISTHTPFHHCRSSY